MSDQSGSSPPGAGEGPGEFAKRSAEHLAALVKEARANGFDFLAYLLGMALKEARRLSAK